MRRIILLALIISLPSGMASATTRIGLTVDHLRFGRFGAVTIYRQSERPANVVLFVSGDGGWNLGVVDMARELTSLNALVVGINITSYLKGLATADEKCSYPAADFEALSQYIQKKFQLSTYVSPVLVGYSSGATLVYAVLVQAPSGTFRGAISMGFCPDLSLPRPLCKQHGLQWTVGPKGKGFVFLPAQNLETPWIALLGTQDQVCNVTAVASFVKLVGRGRVILLPNVGHGFSVPKNWMPQFKQAFTSLTGNSEPQIRSAEAPQVKDLPLVEVSASGEARNDFAVVISGDGGWAGIDRDLGNTLASHGIPVVGINSLQYFWTPRTPETAAKDLERILLYYFAAWNKKSVILIGYSRGAEVLPFMANRLPEDLLAKVQLVALVGPSPTANFEFHLTDWLGEFSRHADLSVLPEVEKLKGSKVVCIYGLEEKDPLCRSLAPSLVRAVALKGGHHFDGNYQAVAEAILKQAK